MKTYGGVDVYIIFCFNRYYFFLSVDRMFHYFIVPNLKLIENILSRVGCITRQLISRRIAYSEFIPLALTFTPFTI
jgi:hypothetical protein